MFKSIILMLFPIIALGEVSLNNLPLVTDVTQVQVDDTFPMVNNFGPPTTKRLYIKDLLNVTSIKNKFQTYAPLANPIFTGTVVGNFSGSLNGNATNVTGIVAVANGGTGAATADNGLNNLLPSQTGNTGKGLTTNGSSTLWSTVANTVNGYFGTVVLGKNDVGLGNVDNTSDVNKPISAATQVALDLKAPLNSPTLTGIPTAPTPTFGDNSTKIATTAFVAASAPPAANQYLSNLLFPVSVNQSLIPRDDSAFDLGESATRWRSIYGNNIYAGGTDKAVMGYQGSSVRNSFQNDYLPNAPRSFFTTLEGDLILSPAVSATLARSAFLTTPGYSNKNTGDILLATGQTANQSSGSMNFFTGTAGVGSGNITIGTGQSSSFSGDLTFRTGVAPTRGQIGFKTNIVNFENANVIGDRAPEYDSSLTNKLYVDTQGLQYAKTISTVGTGADLYVGKFGQEFRIRSLVAGTGITIDQNSDNLTINSSGSNGANTSLSNLTATSINQTLKPTSAYGVDVGAPNKPFGGFWGNYYGFVSNIGSTPTAFGYIETSEVFSTPSADSVKGAFWHTITDKNYGISLWSENSNTSNTGKLVFETGNAGATGFSSGDIKLRTGTGVAGRGKISLNASTVETTSDIVPFSDYGAELGTQFKRFLRSRVAFAHISNGIVDNFGNVLIDTFDGSLQQGRIKVQGNRIQDVGAPTAATDAATRGYVDAAVGSGGGANTTLSNLSTTVTTAINASLYPATDLNYNIGGQVLRFGTVSGNVIASYGKNTGPTALAMQKRPTTGGLFPILSESYLLANYGDSSDSYPLAIVGQNNGTVDSVATQTISILTGNKTAGTGNSGDITVKTGTSSGGTRGKVILDGLSIDASSAKIINAANPTAAQDVVTKNYLETRAANIQVSATSGFYQTTSTTDVSVPNLSVTITTSGRPVEINLIPDGSTSGSFIGVNTQFSGFGGGYVQIFRDTTLVCKSYIYNNSGGPSSGVQIPAGSIITTDVVAAGTYTYTIKLVSDSTATSTRVSQVKLMAFEK